MKNSRFKSRFLAFAFIVLTPFFALGQEFSFYYGEEFTAATVPAVWGAQSVNDATCDGWRFGVTTETSGFFSVPAHPGGLTFAVSNDDAQDCDRFDVLLTPLTNHTGQDSLVLLFDLFLTGAFGSEGLLYVSNDDGTNWISFPLPTATQWQLDLGLTVVNGVELVDGQGPFVFTDQMVFAFIHSDGGDWASGMAVTNVALLGFYDPCDNIETLTCDEQVSLELQGLGIGDWQHTGICDPFLAVGQPQLYSFVAEATGTYTLTVSDVSSESEFPFFQYYVKEASFGCDTLNWTCIGSFGAAGEAQFDLVEGVSYSILAINEIPTPVTQTFSITCPCIAAAGTLTADASPVALVEGSATISATEGTAPFVPAGYSVLYVLTEGAGLVIVDAAATPSFTVTAAGDYTIHTLVYDPLTLDISTVEFGVTTGFDVNGLLIQGGGEICGALDVAGAAIVVEEEETCDATAGTLVADASPVTLVEGSATISATEGTAPFVPAGYSVLYVLTEGAGLVIVDAAATPSFTVTAAGDYTIHTLVYDPLTLDISTVEFGVTTGFDVNGLLIQGGGEICGALDVAGALIVVEDEVVVTCDATAGTLTADASPVTLVGGSATISATEGTAPFVPEGYSVLYVLTEGAGLVIIDAATTPSFTVDAIGDYTIHTLVYDPLTLDVSTVEFGVTTGFDVNGLLIQGGGDICGALDVAGAPIVVDEVVGLIEGMNGSLSVYPNPSNGQFIVELNDAEGVGTLNVMDLTGRTVYTEGVNFSGDFRHSLDLNVASGSYILQMINAEGIATKRLQVK